MDAMTTTLDDTFMRERFDLSDHQLNSIHRAELSACVEEHPDSIWSTDGPLWKLREQHRLEWSARGDVEARQARQEAAAERRAAAAAAKAQQAAERAERAAAPVTKVEPTELRCQDCGTEIQRTGKRGRPPKRCEPCRIAFEAAQTTETKSCGACARGGKGRHLNTCKKGKAVKK